MKMPHVIPLRQELLDPHHPCLLQDLHTVPTAHRPSPLPPRPPPPYVWLQPDSTSVVQFSLERLMCDISDASICGLPALPMTICTSDLTCEFDFLN